MMIPTNLSGPCLTPFVRSICQSFRTALLLLILVSCCLSCYSSLLLLIYYLLSCCLFCYSSLLLFIYNLLSCCLFCYSTATVSGTDETFSFIDRTSPIPAWQMNDGKYAHIHVCTYVHMHVCTYVCSCKNDF